MARDRTFSGKDVIRIWSKHLTREEQIEVACFFNLYVRGISQVNQKQKLSAQLTRKLIGLLASFFPQTAIVEKIIDIFAVQLEIREFKECENATRLLARGISNSLPAFSELIVDLLTSGPERRLLQ